MACIHRSIDQQATLERRMSIFVLPQAFSVDIELREASEELRKLAQTCENLRKLAKTYENLRKLVRVERSIFNGSQ